MPTRFSFLALLVVALLALTPSDASAWCIYNYSSVTVDVAVRGGNFKASLAPKPANGAATSSCCNWQDRTCNASGQQNASVFADFVVTQRQWSCSVSLQAGGTARVWEHVEQTGMPPTLICQGFGTDKRLLAERPRISQPGTRHVRFLATADPQYENDPGASDKRTEKRERTDGVMNALARKAIDSDYRGVIVAGDLTQWTRRDEIAAYNASMLGRWSHIFDGYGNHDMEVGNCCAGVGQQGYCTCFAQFRDQLRERRRVTPITHLEQSHYSWDWHDVHFVQLNLYAGEGPGYGHLRPGDALGFLKRDLQRHVGTSGRPVVLIQHYGIEDFSLTPDQGSGQIWWTPEDAGKLWDAVADYNVIALLTGHDHAPATWARNWSKPATATRDRTKYNSPRRTGVGTTGATIPAITVGGAVEGYYTDIFIDNGSLVADRFKNTSGRTPRWSDQGRHEWTLYQPPAPPPATVGRVTSRWVNRMSYALEPVAGTEFVRLRTDAGTYLHLENAAALDSGNVPAGYQTSHWSLEPVAGESYLRLKNRYRANMYLHNENQRISAGAIQPGWHSAMWTRSMTTGGVATSTGPTTGTPTGGGRVAAVGAQAGRPFELRCGAYPLGVSVRAGAWIDGITLSCLGGPATQIGVGGQGGTKAFFQLRPMEFIRQISGTFGGVEGQYIYSLQFRTSLGRTSPVYGNGGPNKGQTPFTLSVPSGSVMTGVFGWADGYLRSIGLLLDK